MDRFEMTEHDDLIDRLHEKISEGNLYEAKRIADAINVKVKQLQRDRTLAVA